MKKNLFVKFPENEEQHSSNKRIQLINVCAWCPKESYPELGENEDYTHGLCQKHYHFLREQKVTDK